MLRLDTNGALPFLDDGALDQLRPRVEAAHQAVLDKTGAGSDFLGWRDLLLDPNDALLEDLAATAAGIRADADVLLCLGIGGSYLGAQAVIEALTPYFQPRQVSEPAGASPGLFDEGASSTPEILFAGHHMSGAYLRQLLDSLDGKSVYLNVISKSGTTLEPAQINSMLARNVSLELLEFFSSYANEFADDSLGDDQDGELIRSRLPNLLIIGYIIRILEERVE